MHRNRKQTALGIAKFVIPAVIIGYLLWRIEAEDWAAIAQQRKNYGFLAGALGVAAAAICLSFARWCLLVRAQGIELSMLEAFRLGSICFLLNFVSAGSVGGDVFKAIFLARRRPGKRIEAVASVLVDRGCGLYGLLLLVGTAFLLMGSDPSAGQTSDDLKWIRYSTAALVAVGTFAVAVLVLGGRGVDRVLKWAGGLPAVGGMIERVGSPLRMFHSRPLVFALAIVMSVGVQAMLAISMYLIARGLYRAPPTLAEHLLIVPVGMLASALPLTPAGIGVLEAATDWLYRLVPDPPTQASGTLVALVFEIVKLLMAALGTVFYWTAGEEVRDSLEIAEEEVAAGDEGHQEARRPGSNATGDAGPRPT